MRRILFSWSVAILACVSPVFALTDPAEKYPDLDLYLEAKSLVRQAPEWVKPKNIRLASMDINYRLDILPFEEDKYADQYMVIPQLGLITPINKIPQGTADRNKLIKGGLIAENTYLKNGIIEYPGSIAPGVFGNRIDFGHSNYYASDSGRYKTIFANLMWLDAGDQIWYYVKQADGTYGLYKYGVTESYPTNPSDGNALARDGDGADAVVFGCYHGIDGRWIVKATFLGDPIVQDTSDHFSGIPSSYKNRIDQAMQRMQRMPKRWRDYQLVLIYKRVEAIQSKNALSSDEKLILDYIIDWLARLYN